MQSVQLLDRFAALGERADTFAGHVKLSCRSAALVALLNGHLDDLISHWARAYTICRLCGWPRPISTRSRTTATAIAARKSAGRIRSSASTPAWEWTDVVRTGTPFLLRSVHRLVAVSRCVPMRRATCPSQASRAAIARRATTHPGRASPLESHMTSAALTM